MKSRIARRRTLGKTRQQVPQKVPSDVENLLEVTSKNLNAYREKIRDITSKIIDLMAQRQEISEKIADFKVKSYLEVENKGTEKKLLDFTLNHAKKAGLNNETAKKLLNFLINESKKAQARVVLPERVKQNLISLRISNVGIIGAGRMGTWFGEYFSRCGTNVVFEDTDQLRSSLAARRANGRTASHIEQLFLENPDLIVLATPLSAMERLVLQVDEIAGRKFSTSRKNKERIVLLEVGSIKSSISKTLRLCKNLLPISLHPMFGGLTLDDFGAQKSDEENFFEGKKAIILKVKDFKRESEIASLLFPTWEIIAMNQEDHDFAMSYVLSLVHLMNLAFALSVSEVDLGMLMNSSGPSFAKQILLSEEVTKENPFTYSEIQTTNPFAKNSLERFLKHLNEIFSIIEEKDSQRLANLFELMSSKRRRRQEQEEEEVVS
jgi:prephenate dehydrogenase/chorismate mutase